MLAPYELLHKINDTNDQIAGQSSSVLEQAQQMLLNQDEIIVNQEYGNCLLEINQAV